MPFINYATLECIIEKTDGCKNNPENWFTTKVSEHISSAFSMSTISSLRSIQKIMMYTEVKVKWKHFVNP